MAFFFLVYGANSTHIRHPNCSCLIPFILSSPILHAVRSSPFQFLNFDLMYASIDYLFGIAPKPPLCVALLLPFLSPVRDSTTLLFLTPNTPPVPTSLTFTAARHATLHLHSHINAGVFKELISFIHHWHITLLEL